MTPVYLPLWIDSGRAILQTTFAYQFSSLFIVHFHSFDIPGVYTVHQSFQMRCYIQLKTLYSFSWLFILVKKTLEVFHSWKSSFSYSGKFVLISLIVFENWSLSFDVTYISAWCYVHAILVFWYYKFIFNFPYIYIYIYIHHMGKVLCLSVGFWKLGITTNLKWYFDGTCRSGLEE